MKNLLIILITLTPIISGCSSTNKNNNESSFLTCIEDKPRLEARSKELASIVQADQEERKDWNQKSYHEMMIATNRDSLRRQRIGEIFGEGCFSKAEDFSAAALVYQHGNVPEHFFQTYIWAKRAFDLGDVKQKRLMALGLDRYLVNTGHKQLFGSQATKPDLNPETCWCIQQVEKSFPDNLRKDYADKNLTEAFAWLKELNLGNNCPIKECEVQLKSTPKGAIPGFW